MSDAESRLRELGLELPQPPAPAGSYVPCAVSGSLAFVSGQVPFRDGELAFRGKVGGAVDLDAAREAARLCGLNLLAVLRDACGGSLDHVQRCVQIQGFVNCTPDFEQHPAVINGASDLMVEVFGEAGRHARFAVGSNALPFDVPVEIAGVFELD